MRGQQRGPESERGGGAESSSGEKQRAVQSETQRRHGGKGWRDRVQGGARQTKDTQGAGAGGSRKNSLSETWGWTARG